MRSIESILQDLIKFRTDECIGSNAEIVKYITDILGINNVVFEKVLSANKKENIVAVFNRDKLYDIDDALLLSGHMDTVGVNQKDWKLNPFEGTCIDGAIYGRGAVDMKYFIACVLAMIGKLKECKRPVVWVLTQDEESSVCGIRDVIEWCAKRNILFKEGIVGEPTNFALGVANRGCVGGNIEIKGKSAHASKQELGVNALRISNEIISKIFELNDKYLKDRVCFNVGKFICDNKANVIADFVSFEWEMRFDDNGKKQEVLEELYEVIKDIKAKYQKGHIICGIEFDMLAFEENKKSKLIKKIKNEFVIDVKKFDYATEAGFWQKYGVDVVIFGAGDENLAHTNNEYIKVEDLYKYLEMILRIVE